MGKKTDIGILLKKRDHNSTIKVHGSQPQIAPSEAQKQKFNKHNKQINLKELRINSVNNKKQESDDQTNKDSQNKENYQFISSADVRLKRMQRF